MSLHQAIIPSAVPSLTEPPERVFRRWVSISVTEPSEAITSQRRLAVSNAASSFNTVQDALSLVRIASQRPRSERDKRVAELLVEAASREDNRFPKTNNELAIAVLAAGIIQHLLHSSSRLIEDTLALAVLAVAPSASSTGELFPDLSAIASEYYASRAYGVRAPLVEARPTSGARGSNTGNGSDASPSAESEQEMESLEAEIESHDLRLAAQQEQLDLAWLVLTEALPSGESIAKVPHLSLPLVLGRALADVTTFRVGPPGAYALIRRMLGLNSKVRVGAKLDWSETIESPVKQWRESWVNAIPESTHDLFEGLAIVWTATRRSLEVDGSSLWLPAFRHSTGLTKLPALTSIDFAWQAYVETLLANVSPKE